MPARKPLGLVPHLVVNGAVQAIDFYKKALGAEEIRRMPFPSQIDPSERKQLRRQLKQLRIERRELNDMLIVPALRVVR